MIALSNHLCQLFIFFGILATCTRGSFLRQRGLLDPLELECVPPDDDSFPQNDEKIYVLLELDGSERVPTITEIINVNSTFVDAYDSVVQCSQKGAIRNTIGAIIVADALYDESQDSSYDFQRGNFTWLVEVDLDCNACGQGDRYLFNFNTAASSDPSNDQNPESNTCECLGPNKNDFLPIFRALLFVETVSLEGNSSTDLTAINATQVVLLSREECDSQPTTRYNYDGVCLGHIS